MKKCVFAAMGAVLAVGVFTGCSGKSNLPEQYNIPPAVHLAAAGEQKKMSIDSVCKEDYQKLLALQLDGYEDMTISEYRSRIGKLTDSAEYSSLLEWLGKNRELYELRDTDKTAGFLFYVLPLTGDEWKTRNYSGEATSFYPKSGARLEYSFSLTVLEADTLTIREYNTTRLHVIRGMQDIVKGKTEEELQDPNSILADIQKNTDNLVRQLQTDKIGITIEYAWFPDLTQETEKTEEYPEGNTEQEVRRYSHGTEEDYRSLLALKTPSYQNMTIADFNRSLLAWANADTERMERIDEDTRLNDFAVRLTAEELSFVETTVRLSGMENGKQIQSIYAGSEPANPFCGEYLPEKTAGMGRGKARCSLHYQFSYSLTEAKTVTVGERDRRLKGAVNAVRRFWSNTNIEALLQMDKSDIAKELEKIAEAYSNENITITADEKQLYFECMDERNIF